MLKAASLFFFYLLNYWVTFNMQIKMNKGGTIYFCLPFDRRRQLFKLHQYSLIFVPYNVIKISWTDHVRNEEVLLRVNEHRNILHEIRKRKANWIGYILRRNCPLQQVTEGKIKELIEVTRRRGRRRKKLLDDLKDRRGYCQLKEEALDRTVWRNRFGRGLDLSFDRLLMMMTQGICYTKNPGDGNSNSYQMVVAEKPYGSYISVTKL